MRSSTAAAAESSKLQIFLFSTLVDKIIAFGDNLNDIPLFEIADECYAVSNAEDELKAIATGIIASNEEDAVAEFMLARYKSEEGANKLS